MKIHTHSYVRFSKKVLTDGIKHIDKIERTRKNAKVYFLRYQDFISGKIGIIYYCFFLLSSCVIFCDF